MTSPESPAVQDTDLAADLAQVMRDANTVSAWDLNRGLGPNQVPFGHFAEVAIAWMRAAVLPVHREMVLGEAVDALDDELDRVKDAYIAERMSDLAESAAPGMSPRWSAPESAGRVREWKRARNLVRRLAVSAPPTPPGSPPADERATAVETGRGWRRGVRELAVAPNVWVSFHGLDFAVAWHPVPGDSYRNVVKVIPHAKAPAGAVPGTGDEPDWRTEPAGKHVAAVQRWMALDLWIALGVEPADFETKIGASGWAETWDTLLSSVRDGNTIRAALAADRDRLALDLQARDIAVREAGRLREQAEADRDQAVLALGDLRGREALLVAERDDARESAASILNDAGALAETIRRYEPVIEAAKSWRAYGWNTLAGDPAERLSAAIEALGDIPSPTAPEAPDDLDRFIAEQMHDPEFRTAWERQAGRLPLAEVLAALRDDEGMWEWASQFGDSRNACVVSISDRERLALYLSDRLDQQGADTKETSTDG